LQPPARRFNLGVAPSPLRQVGLALTAALLHELLGSADLPALLGPIGDLAPLLGRQIRQGIELWVPCEVPASFATSGIASPRAASPGSAETGVSPRTLRPSSKR
jgi:hypothetical protein